MKYRYAGTGFTIEVQPGEGPGDTLKRVRADHALADKPPGQLLSSQVRLVHAIEGAAAATDFNEAKPHLLAALRELARSTHNLEAS